MKQVRVSGRYVPWSLTLSVLCWLLVGAWSGLGILITSLFIPPEIRDSGWFGAGTLAVLTAYAAVAMGVPILMLYRARVARALLSLVAAWFTVAVIAAPSLEPRVAYIPVTVGAVLMWLPLSKQYLRKRIIRGNQAVP
jgi:hypothetical protein